MSESALGGPIRRVVIVAKLGPPEGRRLALSIDLGCYAVHPEIEANARSAAAALAARGAIVEEIALDWSAEIDRAWYKVWGVFMAAYFGQHLSEWRDRMDPEVVALIEVGEAMSAVDYKRIEILRSEQWRELARVLSQFETPKMSTPTSNTSGSKARAASTI